MYLCIYTFPSRFYRPDIETPKRQTEHASGLSKNSRPAEMQYAICKQKATAFSIRSIIITPHLHNLLFATVLDDHGRQLTPFDAASIKSLGVRFQGQR
jgi:hypothetical protein